MRDVYAVSCTQQMLDLVRPKHKEQITLRDLKSCKMTNIFFDTFFNLDKFLEHEQRDPFANVRVSFTQVVPRCLDDVSHSLMKRRIWLAWSADVSKHCLLVGTVFMLHLRVLVDQRMALQGGGCTGLILLLIPLTCLVIGLSGPDLIIYTKQIN